MIIYRNRPKIAEHFEWEVRKITLPKEGAFKFELQRYVWDYIEFRAARYRRTLVDTLHGMIGHLLCDGPIAEFQRYRSIMFRHKRDYEEFMSAAFGSANQNHHWKLLWHDHWMTDLLPNPERTACSMAIGKRARSLIRRSLKGAFLQTDLVKLSPDNLTGMQANLGFIALNAPRPQPITLDEHEERMARFNAAWERVADQQSSERDHIS